MIYIVSAGRSGSAWLAACLKMYGLDVQHEGLPAKPSAQSFDVIADTAAMWRQDEFIANLKPDDTVVILSRNLYEVGESVKRLLGEDAQVERTLDRWRGFSMAVAGSHGNILFIDYDGMMKSPTSIARIASLARLGPDYNSTIRDIWRFMQHMRVTNKTCEDAVIESVKEHNLVK